MNLTLKNCRGQRIDGASNMSQGKSRIATQIKVEEPRAIFSHCYGHSLQLDVGDMMKEVKNIKDALDTTSEMSGLLINQNRNHCSKN